MSAAPSRKALLSLRCRFAGLPEECHKQIGLRAIRDALARLENAPELAAELAAKAERHLALAEALERRAGLVEMDKVRLIHALLEAAPDMPQELRWGLGDYADEVLGRGREPVPAAA